MKIYNQGISNWDKVTIYLDIDDVVLKSSEAIVNIVNRLNSEKGIKSRSVDELKDWGFKSIQRNLTQKELCGMFNSDEFWSNVKLNEVLMEALQYNNCELYNNFNWIFTTHGNEENQLKKFEYIFNVPFFKEHKKEIGYYAIDMSEDKSTVRMVGGIQIDDNYNNLKNTDADVKILLTNLRETDYNSVYHVRDNLQNLYIANTMEEALEILKFFTNEEELEEVANIDW